MSSDQQTIRAKQCEEGDLYVHVDDLIKAFEEDSKDLFQGGKDEVAVKSMVMTLTYIKRWYIDPELTECVL